MASVEELLRNRPGRVAEILRGLPWLECPELCKAITTAVTSFEAQRELIADSVKALEGAHQLLARYIEQRESLDMIPLDYNDAKQNDFALRAALARAREALAK